MKQGFQRNFNIEIEGDQVIQMSNFVGFMLDEALKRGFKSSNSRRTPWQNWQN